MTTHGPVQTCSLGKTDDLPSTERPSCVRAIHSINHVLLTCQFSSFIDQIVHIQSFSCTCLQEQEFACPLRLLGEFK